MDALTSIEDSVLQAFKANPFQTLQSIGDQLGVTRERVRQIRNSLAERGFLRRQPEYVPVERMYHISDVGPKLTQARLILQKEELTAKELADRLGMKDRNSIYNWRNKGLITLKEAKRGRPGHA